MVGLSRATMLKNVTDLGYCRDTGQRKRLSRGQGAWNRRIAQLGLLSLALTLAGTRTAQAGQWKPLGPYGGTIEALAIDPVTPSTLYVGTQFGGLFKSTNGGASWTAIGIGVFGRDVEAVAINPVTPTTLYAGTGLGLFMSTDGGANWRLTKLNDSTDRSY